MVDTIYQVVNSTCGSIRMEFSILATGKRAYFSHNTIFYLERLILYSIITIMLMIVGAAIMVPVYIYRQEPVET